MTLSPAIYLPHTDLGTLQSQYLKERGLNPHFDHVPSEIELMIRDYLPVCGTISEQVQS